MARIAGVDIPKDKRVERALTYIYGVGPTAAKKIAAEAKIDLSARVKDLSEEQIGQLKNVIESNYVVEGALRKNVKMDVDRLVRTRSFRGMRHVKSKKSKK